MCPNRVRWSWNQQCGLNLPFLRKKVFYGLKLLQKFDFQSSTAKLENKRHPTVETGGGRAFGRDAEQNLVHHVGRQHTAVEHRSLVACEIRCHRRRGACFAARRMRGQVYIVNWWICGYRRTGCPSAIHVKILPTQPSSHQELKLY